MHTLAWTLSRTLEAYTYLEARDAVQGRLQPQSARPDQRTMNKRRIKHMSCHLSGELDRHWAPSIWRGSEKGPLGPIDWNRASI